jgi:hypothetical protein
VRNLLLALYPASWRTRYGEEFEQILSDRPLGPFDVADVLLGALDAHLHLRGLGAASQHGKGFAMSLRIGGWAAIAGGVLWFIGLAAASANDSDNDEIWSLFLLAGTAALLVALVGLSAFQARRNPRLVWAAFILPAVGAVVSIVGIIGMAVVGDRPFLGDLSPWYVWIFGMLAMFIGSALFGIATLRAGTLSRPGAVMLAVGSFVIVPVMAGMTGEIISDQVGMVLMVLTFLAFAGGWVLLGVSALRAGRPIATSLEGAMS